MSKIKFWYQKPRWWQWRKKRMYKRVLQTTAPTYNYYYKVKANDE